MSGTRAVTVHMKVHVRRTQTKQAARLSFSFQLIQLERSKLEKSFVKAIDLQIISEK